MNAIVDQPSRSGISVFGPSSERLDRLGEWFAAEYEPLLRFAYFVTGDHEAARDTVQDAFIKIYKAGGRVEHEGFPAYARRTVANLGRSRFRRQRSERAAIAGLPRVAEGVRDSDPVERDEVWAAILRLSKQQRAVVALRFYEHMTESQISATLGVSAGTVKKQLSRALDRLSIELEGRPR
ncbi:MAG TPA: SigE family RNA polymerase sigma factor [Actinomycetota bacterium]|nr:SigE family RNA polymerase sigma factor [Actinomycetota bacterium]